MLRIIDIKLYYLVVDCFLKLFYLFYWLQACDQSDDRYWSVLYIRAGEGSLSAKAWPDRLLIIAICYLVCWCSAHKGERKESTRRDDRSWSHSRGWNLHFAAVTAPNTNSILREYSQPLSRIQLYRLKSKVQSKKSSVFCCEICNYEKSMWRIDIENRFSITIFIWLLDNSIIIRSWLFSVILFNHNIK